MLVQRIVCKCTLNVRGGAKVSLFFRMCMCVAWLCLFELVICSGCLCSDNAHKMCYISRLYVCDTYLVWAILALHLLINNLWWLCWFYLNQFDILLIGLNR